MCVFCPTALRVNVQWLRTANEQKHNQKGGKPRNGAKILIRAFCGAVLVTPVQMDSWMREWSLEWWGGYMDGFTGERNHARSEGVRDE